MVNVDSMRSHRLVNQQQFYVSISRARLDAQVFTNDRLALAHAVGRHPRKALAMEVVKPAPVTTRLRPSIHHEPRTAAIILVATVIARKSDQT